MIMPTLRPLLFILIIPLVSACGSSSTNSPATEEDNNNTQPGTPATPSPEQPDTDLSITSPATNNQTISGTFNVQTTTSSDDVFEVTFSINDETIGSDSTQPFELEWNTLNYTDGTYRLTASASNSSGDLLSTSSRLLVVSNTQETSECSLTSTEQALLDAHNTARAQARQCGGESFAATNPLQWNCRLASAAQAHSDDMIQNDFFDHVGSDDSKPWDRASDAGYVYRTIGENIAANQRSVDSVMDGWLNSPGHCSNIMNPNFKEIGANRTDSTTSSWSIYWTALFGTQR